MTDDVDNLGRVVDIWWISLCQLWITCDHVDYFVHFRMYELVIMGGLYRKVSGDYWMKETPVPIPNTEVKLQTAENT